MLNGTKRFITNAGVAGTYIVTAVTDRDTESRRITAFIVPADAPGFSIGRMEEKMGLHASNTGELIFDDCRVPTENMLGPEGEGDKLFLKTLDGGRIGIASMALGLAQAAYEAASAYAKERRQFGRAIGEFQGVAFMIADMAMKIDAARLMTYRAAWLKDCGQPYSTEAAMAKLFASEVARDVTNDADPGSWRLRLRHRVQASSATSATRSSPRSARGPARSSGWSSRATCWACARSDQPRRLLNSTDQRQALPSAALHHAVRMPASPPGRMTIAPRSSSFGQRSSRLTASSSMARRVIGR